MFVLSQETHDDIVYRFLCVLKFWLNLLKAVPEWRLLWPVSQ